jgi:Ca2+:H+ antiporter
MADALSSLMIITATALILPTALYSTFTSAEQEESENRIRSFSRGSAFVMLGLYVIYLHFELTHSQVFLNPPEEPVEEEDQIDIDGETQSVQLNPYTAMAILLTATFGIVICANYLVDSVDGTSKATHITKTFIAAILIPIASNAPEAATIISSRGSKVNYGIGVIVGSILQIALFVIPFLVIIGWIIGQPLTLYFETFQTTMLFLSVLVVNRLLQDRVYTYVQGAMLVAL